MGQCRIRIVSSTERTGPDFGFAARSTDRETVRLSVHVGPLVKSVEVSAADAAVMAQMVIEAASDADQTMFHGFDPTPGGGP